MTLERSATWKRVRRLIRRDTAVTALTGGSGGLVDTSTGGQRKPNR
jgi:hypothetical protein